MFRSIRSWVSHYIWCDAQSVPTAHPLTAVIQTDDRPDPPQEADLNLLAADAAEVCAILEYLARLGTTGHIAIQGRGFVDPLGWRRVERVARRCRKFGVVVEYV